MSIRKRWTDQLPGHIVAKIDADGDCWLWMAATTGDGYGAIKIEGKVQVAHRVVYELLVGPIETETLDHLCRVRLCVNPAHLEPVSNRTNVLRGVGISAVNARKTHCKRGHPLFGENLHLVPGGRECRECSREGTRRWRRKEARR